MTAGGAERRARRAGGMGGGTGEFTHRPKTFAHFREAGRAATPSPYVISANPIPQKRSEGAHGKVSGRSFAKLPRSDAHVLDVGTPPGERAPEISGLGLDDGRIRIPAWLGLQVRDPLPRFPVVG